MRALEQFQGIDEVEEEYQEPSVLSPYHKSLAGQSTPSAAVSPSLSSIHKKKKNHAVLISIPRSAKQSNLYFSPQKSDFSDFTSASKFSSPKQAKQGKDSMNLGSSFKKLSLTPMKKNKSEAQTLKNPQPQRTNTNIMRGLVSDGRNSIASRPGMIMLESQLSGNNRSADAASSLHTDVEEQKENKIIEPQT